MSKSTRQGRGRDLKRTVTGERRADQYCPRVPGERMMKHTRQTQTEVRSPAGAKRPAEEEVCSPRRSEGNSLPPTDPQRFTEHTFGKHKSLNATPHSQMPLEFFCFSGCHLPGPCSPCSTQGPSKQHLHNVRVPLNDNIGL